MDSAAFPLRIMRRRASFATLSSIFFLSSSLYTKKFFFSSGKISRDVEGATQSVDENGVPSSRSSPGNIPLPSLRSHSSRDTERVTEFWPHDLPAVPLSQLKSEYGAARTADRRSRFRVRGGLKEDGVISNFYPLKYPKDRCDAFLHAPLFIYEMQGFRTVTVTKGKEIDSTTMEGREDKTVDSRKRNATEKICFDEISKRDEKRDEKKKKQKGKKGGGSSPLSSDTQHKAVLRPLHSSAMWRAVWNHFAHVYPEIPPLIRLDSKIYMTTPLLEKALQIPPSRYDVGWDSCELSFLGKYSFCSLPLDELQRLVNKIVPWCVRRNEVRDRHAVVREAKGKFVCTDTGLKSNGVRVYQGVTVQALFLGTSKSSNTAMPLMNEEAQQFSIHGSPSHLNGAMMSNDVVVSSRDLGEVKCEEPVKPIQLTVHEYIRSFDYKGKNVESYKIKDASGVYLASLWEPTQPRSLKVGNSYLVDRWKLKIYREKNNMRLFEFQKWSVFTEISNSKKTQVSDGAPAKDPSSPTIDILAKAMDVPVSPPSSSLLTPSPDPSLVLKIDSKGTVASEKSLWADVFTQFGKGPFDRHTQQRIRHAVEGTPIVTSCSLHQGILRIVSFDVLEESEESRFLRQFLTPESRDVLEKLDLYQPFGILQDGTLWPFQLLHCCFDPRMKSWQDATVSSLSLLPKKRVELLGKFQKVLESGLSIWGLALSDQPWRTKAVSILTTPQKESDRRYQYQKNIRYPFPSSHPTTVAVVGILQSSRSNENTESIDSPFATRIRETVSRMGNYFKTNLMTCVNSEGDALNYLTEQGLRRGEGVPESFQKRNSAVVFVTTEKDARMSRWMYAECLSQGVLPLATSAPKSPKLQALLCGNIKRQLITSFESDPLFGVQIYREVPFIKGKNILFVGIDTCHTSSHSVGSTVGVFCTPERNHLIPHFWRQHMRGSEVGDVSNAFHQVFQKAKNLYQKVDEVVVFQDGDLFRSMTELRSEIQLILPLCGFTFMCLHKRGNIRFMHGKGYEGQPLASVDVNNIVKGSIIEDLTPLSLDEMNKSREATSSSEGSTSSCSSFYLQSHDGNMSTSRIVHYTVHHSSPTLPIPTVQMLANVMSNVLAPQPTKLPMPTRCAHRLADKAERLLDAVPELECNMIPSPLCERLWFF